MTVSAPSDNPLATALWLADRGVHVHPLHPATKDRPYTRWREASTADPDRIRAWWSRWPDANLAVDTGKSGLYVVDLDGPDAFATWHELGKRHGHAPTLTVATGRGRHHWYRAPAGRTLANTAGLIAVHVDTRGVGGYVLAPPSVHPSGALYEWWPGADRPAALPEWVARRVTPPPPRQWTPRADGAPSKVEGLLRYLASRQEGERDLRTFSVACTLIEEGHGAELDRVVEAAVSTGLSERQARKCIDSAYRRVGRKS